LLGIPHVLLDNSYGKVRGFYEAWTSECSFVRWAGSTDDALVQAERFLPSTRPRRLGPLKRL
jgi:exopolysaccharide biosynthesis predicted pyruvyltransferase EpsI